MRVGLVGAGSMGTVHAAAWRAAGAELVGIHATDSEGARTLAERHQSRAYEDLDALLAAVNVVDLCVPTHLHRDLTLRAASTGKHVVCEKPIALSVEDGEEMIAACEAAGVRLFVAMVVRFFPQYARAHDLVSRGEIGDAAVLRLRRVSYAPTGRGDNWFTDEARSGGMVVDLMIHDFDIARWIAGDVTRVFARSAPKSTPDAHDDQVLATLRHANGAMTLVEGGWAYPPGLFRTGLDVAGTKGVIEWSSDDPPGLRQHLRASESGATAAVGLPAGALGEDPYETEIRHVLHALETGEPFTVTPQDALEALRIALAARESTRTGQPVTLREVQQ
jgi:myo-inositol 2-dehydrogenase/D-chiro-inositol 1-dehydrogenase